MNNEPSLSSFRSRFFPVYNHELLGFFLLSACFLCVALEYAVLRGCKDTLVLCLKEGGAEAIAASKVFVILFMVLFKVMYDVMCKYVSRYHRFNVIFAYFIFFFLLTLFVLYPNRENWQIVTLTNRLNDVPVLKRFWPIWLMVRHWPITLIYMHAECVGSFGLGVSLWGVANYISTVDQSKRIYPLFSFFAGLGTWIAGGIIKDPKMFPMERIFMVCVASFVILLLIYNWFIRVIKSKPGVYVTSKKTKKKLRLGLKESFAVLFRSRYFTGVTLLVLGYAISIVLFEAVYRDSLKSLAGVDEKVIRSWTSSQLSYIGILQMICVFMAPYIMRRKWEFGAALVPRIILIGTFIFFGLLYFGKYLPWGNLAEGRLGYLITLTGLVIIVLVKTQKYMSFDPTKERLYVVLNDDEKIMLKSAVDGVSSRIGKGFPAMLTTFFIVPYYGDIASAKLLIGSLILITIIVWLWAIKDVGARFEALLKSRQKIDNAAQRQLDASSGANKPKK